VHGKKFPDEIEIVFFFFNIEFDNTVPLPDLLRRRYTKLQVGPRRAFRVWPVSGLSLSKCFGPISGQLTKLFRNDVHLCRQLPLKESSWINLQ